MDEVLQLPIGVFDSGVGGLTVLDAIHRALPQEDLLYLGDTARVPYGTKSADSVCRYARQAAQALVDRKVKALVIACNTATAVALQAVARQHPQIPVIGVVEPGARASCQSSRSGHIGVIATESTIHGGAYQQAIKAIRPDARVIGQSCSLFVALAEEGWTEGPLVEQILARYLDPLFEKALQQGLNVDCLVLGCTHFPVLKRSIAAVLGNHVRLVDSASTTAELLRAHFSEHQLYHPLSNRTGQIGFLVTDGVDRFSRVATAFFGHRIESGQVELVDMPAAGFTGNTGSENIN